MLSVWWNFEGVLHFEMVPEGRSVNADLYCQQLDRVYATIREKYLLGFSNKADCFDLKAKTVYSNVNVLFYHLQVSS
jgi:hypothetical protein